MKVLIAEDEALSRRLLESALKALGHDCISGRDGAHAWELFREHGADVIISDWMMPGLSGDELCRRVREEQRGTYTYFILLTALDDKTHVLTGMEAGADDYLTKPLDRSELQMRLIAATRITALHQRLEEQQAELERLNAGLYEDARTDPLTGAGNRLRLEEDLEAVSARVQRYDQSYAVALCDVDNFKAYNDTCGHLAGDQALREITDVLAASIRGGDAVYRYGGEELLVLLAGQGEEMAAVAGERLRHAVEDLAIPHPGIDERKFVTISAGIATLHPSDVHDLTGFLERADAALYRAKAAGRNRVMVAEEAGTGSALAVGSG